VLSASRRQSLEISGLKARNMKAQGEALGYTIQRTQALKEGKQILESTSATLHTFRPKLKTIPQVTEPENFRQVLDCARPSAALLQ
jgi:hypothetical protein